MRELKIRDFSKKKTSNERSEWSDSDDTPSGSETEESDDENMSAESENEVEGTGERRANVVANHFGWYVFTRPMDDNLLLNPLVVHLPEASSQQEKTSHSKC